MTPENDRKTMKDLKEFPAVVGGGESAAVVADPVVSVGGGVGGSGGEGVKEPDAYFLFRKLRRW